MTVVGTTISHYKIIEKIGQGGMGEVFLAQDTTLDRKVALKFLPEELQQETTARKRFLREAKSAAALDHPFICKIYEVEEADDKSFISMEYVQGETLKDRLAGGPLPLKNALQTAVEVAEALEAAHKNDIVHRDLKPSNIMLTPEGHVKVMDFGLAKRVTPVEGEEEEITTVLTGEGSMLGTIPYMSPEQLKGESVDARSDIFSFGVVLYEMLVGVHPFKRGGHMETAKAVLSDTAPPLTRYTEYIPLILQHTIKKMLAKEPDRRYQLIHDVRTDLEELREDSGDAIREIPTGPSGTIAAAGRWRRAIPWSVALLMGVIAISIALWRSPERAPAPTTRFAITPSAPLASASAGNVLAISSDGRHVVHRTNTGKGSQLTLRSLDDLSDRSIPGTEGSTWGHFFSPDGESVGFFAGGQLKKVSLPGGSPITLCDTGITGGSGSWGPDDTIVFSGGDTTLIQLYQVAASGGQREILATPDSDKGENWYTGPQILPGGKAVLFSIGLRQGTSYQIAALLLETGEQKILIENGRQPKYVETGHLVYEQLGTGNLMAVRFDLETLEVTSDPVPVLQGVRQNPSSTVDYALSDQGTLLYVPTSEEKTRLVWVDREGRTQRVTEIQRNFHEPRFSPDGTRLSVTVWDEAAGRNIWIYEIAREILTPFTVDGYNARAIWSPDGQRLLFGSARGRGGTMPGVQISELFQPQTSSIVWMPIDGSAETGQLATSDTTGLFPTSWSPDDLVAYVEFTGVRSADILVLPFKGEREPEAVLATPYNERNAIFSPNGRWMAFTSNRSGQTEVYVKPYPGQGGIVPISTDGGREPVWARSGKELFYRTGDQMMVVSVQTDTTFKAEKPRLLFEGSYRYNFTGVTSNYDITADGQQFVMVQEEGTRRINVVLNWSEELKRLVPVP